MTRYEKIARGAAGVVLGGILTGCAGAGSHLNATNGQDTSVQTAAGSTAPAPTLIDPETGMEFVQVQGGCFNMGNDAGEVKQRPRHEVCVDSFYMGRHEVTQAAWQKIMGTNVSQFAACGPDCPVENVSWNDVQNYLKQLNARTGVAYRLPTEAEWEFAARSGGRDEAWAGTASESQLAEYAWFEQNSGATTHKVGQKKANGLGLYDMSGNVYEWCQDLYGETYYQSSPKDNPTGATGGDNRVLRGGSWADPAVAQRTDDRGRDEAGGTSPSNGFRLLRPLK